MLIEIIFNVFLHIGKTNCNLFLPYTRVCTYMFKFLIVCKVPLTILIFYVLFLIGLSCTMRMLNK